MSVSRIVISALAATLLTAEAAPAQQLIACVNTKNGGMRLVGSPADCNTSKEAAVSWNVVGPEGPQGDPGAEGPQGPPGPLLRVFDGEGNVLGIPNGRGGWFFNQEMGLSVTWATARGENSGARIFYFTEENCEGQAFLELNTNRTFFNALIGPYPSPFPTYYVASGDAAPQLIQTASELVHATCSPREGGDPRKVIPAVPFTGTLPFTIPVPEPIYVGTAP